MRRHTVTESELDEWLRTPRWQSFASSCTEFSHKGLEVDATPHGPVFRVTDHGEVTFLGADRAAAVAAYNASR